jgi:hypothetical protein
MPSQNNSRLDRLFCAVPCKGLLGCLPRGPLCGVAAIEEFSPGALPRCAGTDPSFHARPRCFKQHPIDVPSRGFDRMIALSVLAEALFVDHVFPCTVLAASGELNVPVRARVFHGSAIRYRRFKKVTRSDDPHRRSD